MAESTCLKTSTQSDEESLFGGGAKIVTTIILLVVLLILLVLRIASWHSTIKNSHSHAGCLNVSRMTNRYNC